MSSVGHEEQLWCGVIDQALFDAQSKRTSKQAQHDKQAALRWLLIPNKDFDIVCALASLDPDAVRDRVRRMTGGGSRLSGNSL
jgi:hypothetical protein